MTTPLTGDPRRSASDSIGGYVFQLWHSAFAWLDLSGDGFLYLEGAEDIDQHGKRTTVVNQVKREEANLTLNSGRAREVIENFWEVRTKNVGQDISFRLISTSDIGQEQNDPFTGRRGIEVWNSPVKTAKDRAQLKAFLKIQAFSPALKKFVKESTPDEIDETLVRRIRWDMKQPHTQAVISAIESKLVLLGEKLGIGAADAKDVAPHLFSRVASTAVEKDLIKRRLDRTELLELFDEKTKTRVPNNFLRRYDEMVQSLTAAPGTSNLQINISVSLASPHVPQSNVQLIFRPDVVRQILDLLQHHEVLTLHGSTGMGKTRLAATTVREKSLLWVDLSTASSHGAIGTEVKAVIEDVTRRLDRHPDIQLLVLDDLDMPPSVFEQCKTSLEALLYTLLNRGTRLLVTSQKQLPAQFVALCGKASVESFSVPAFDEDEIKSLLTLYGCPQDQLHPWTVHVSAVTANHPQLAHARVVTLASQKWPALTLQSFFEIPPDVSEQKRHASQLLNETRPEDLELIYPLSLLTGRFRRDLAVRVGETIGNLPNAGDCFDRVVGPWIEFVGDGYYRLSPLLDGTAANAWTPEKVASTREALGKAVLECGKLTLIEAGHILFQATMSRSNMLFAHFIPAIMGLPAEGRRAFAQQCSWYCFFHFDKMEKLLPSVRRIALSLQLIIALETRPESVLPILETIRGMCIATDEADRILVVWSEMQVFLGAKEISVRLAAQLLVHFHEAGTSQWTDPETQRLMHGANLRESLQSEGTSYDDTLVAMLLQRVRDPASMADLISEVRSDTKLAVLLKGSFARSSGLATQFVDPAWLAVEKGTDPDWNAILPGLSDAALLGEQINSQALYEAATRAIVVINDEYIDDANAVETVLSTALRRFDQPGPILLDSQATYFFNRSRWSDALAIWEKIIPDIKYDPIAGDTVAVWGRRKAGIAAGHLGEWKKSAAFFADASAQITHAIQEPLRLGLLADSANALWSAGLRDSALERFSEVLAILCSLDVSKDNLPLFKLQRCLGQSLINISRHKTGILTGLAYKTPIGFCSAPETSEKFKELPFTPTETMWTFFIDTELGTKIPQTVKDRVKLHLTVSRNPYNRFRYWDFAIEESLQCFSGDLAGFPNLCQQYVTTLSVLTSEQAKTASVRYLSVDPATFLPTPANTVGKWVLSVLDVMLLGIAGRHDTVKTLQPWKLEASTLPLSAVLNAWVDEVDQVLRMDEYDLMNLLKNTNHVTPRYAAALRLIRTQGNFSLDDLYCVHVLVLEQFHDNPLFSTAGELIAQQMVEEWRQRLGQRAQFRIPNVSIPPIQEALDSDRLGLKKLASVLIAARSAVWVNIPDDFIEHFKKLALIEPSKPNP